MPFGAAIPIIGLVSGHAARIGVTSASFKAASGTFAQSLPFGAGYSFGTYLGFPGNYKQRKTYQRASTNVLRMPYYGYGGNYRSRGRYSYGRSRYSRYGRRRPYRRSYRSYRRYY